MKKDMLKEFVVLHLSEALQSIADSYIRESYDNVEDTIKGASLDELVGSLSDAISPFFGRDNWMELENYVYDVLTKDEKNLENMKSLLIGIVNFVEPFKEA